MLSNSSGMIANWKLKYFVSQDVTKVSNFSAILYSRESYRISVSGRLDFFLPFISSVYLHKIFFTKITHPISTQLDQDRHIGSNTGRGVTDFTILHLLQCLTLFLTPFYRVNVCLLFVQFGELICEPYHRTKMPCNEIKQDFHFTTLKRFKIIKLTNLSQILQ